MKKVIVLLAVMVLIASSAVATVVGTPHDLSGGSGEICRFCHTPHHGETAAPLWSRNVVAPTAFYTSVTFNGGTAGSGGASLCLSCHVSGLGSQEANIGTDLRDDHPVGFSYATSAANDVEIKPIGAGSVQALLGGGTFVGCYTCHDVHDNSNGEFLKMSNANSAMCKACHIK